MGRKLFNGFLHCLTQVPLAVQVVRTRSRVFELQWTVVVLPIPTNGLEENQWVPGPVAQFVLRQVRGDRIDPRRELPRPVEAVYVTVDAHEYFLHQVFRAFAITSGTVDE